MTYKWKIKENKLILAVPNPWMVAHFLQNKEEKNSEKQFFGSLQLERVPTASFNL